MTTYVFRAADSKGARALAEALPDGRRWKDKIKPLERKVTRDDRVVFWGDYKPNFPLGPDRTLNNVPLTNKLTDALALRAAGVPTIEVSATKPQDLVRVIPAGPDAAVQQWEKVAEMMEDFANMEIGDVVPRGVVTNQALDEFIRELTTLRQAVGQPAPTAREERTTAEGWIPRNRNHVGGNDLLTPPTTPDFWAKKLDVVEEYRIHSFFGRSIAAAIKDHRIDEEWVRSGKTPHPWVRSWDGGWRVRYADFTPKQGARDVAHAAIKALGLDFGAVDVYKLADGTYGVFEVNRAPGIEGQTVEKYVSAVERWKSGELARPTTEQEG
jgi:hypothetical protein